MQLVINEFLKYFRYKRDNRDGAINVEGHLATIFEAIGNTFALVQSCGNIPIDSVMGFSCNSMFVH